MRERCEIVQAVKAGRTALQQVRRRWSGGLAVAAALSLGLLATAGCGSAADRTTTAASAVLSATKLSFHATTVGNAGGQGSVTLTNMGKQSLQVSGIALSDTTNFAMSSTCASRLEAGASCVLTVQFVPRSAAALQAKLTVTDDSGGQSGAEQVVTLEGTGTVTPQAQATLSPTALSFATTVLHNAVAAQTVTLANAGSATLNISGVALSDTADFNLTGTTCGSALAAGASCTYAVSFQPQTVGPLTATLQITDNSGGTVGSQQSVGLSGTGSPVPVAQGVLAPAALDFGPVTVQTSSTAQTVTLSNAGTALLTLSGAALADTKNFSLQSTCGTSLAAGASCALQVTFHPVSTGDAATTLTLTDNSGVSGGTTQQTVQVSGTGVALPVPQAVLTPLTVSFADTMMTTSSPVQTVTVSNAGSAPLLLSGMTLSDTQNFSLSSACPGTLAAGASCTLGVVFQPQSVAALGAVLTVVDNSGATGSASGATVQQTVKLQGKGTTFTASRAQVSPASLSYAPTDVNTSAAPQAVTLSNTGSSALQLSGVSLTGDNSGAFQIMGGNCEGQLAPGAACTEQVSYSPTFGSTADSASLLFTDDALGVVGSTQAVTLSGRALATVDTVEHFGDSVTCGFYAQPNDGTGLVYSLEGYAGLFDTWLGKPAQNWCRQGDTAADLARLWVPFHSTPSATGNQLFTLMVGVNDGYRYGIVQDAEQTYKQEVGGAVAWLAMPNEDKVLANAITQRAGTWTPDIGFGMQSTDAGASLTWNVNQAVAGRNLYVVYHVWAQPYGVAGKATIAVDGTVQATVEESQNSLVRIPTENGTTDTYLLQTVPLGAAGPHTVTFSSAGPAGSEVGLLWAGVAQENYAQVNGSPRVLLGLVTNSPSGNQTAAAANYNFQLRDLQPLLVSDGLNVVLVPTDDVLNPGGDFVDLLHPDNAGHAKLAAVFEQYR